MSYYIRILSASTEAPTTADLKAAAVQAGHPLTGVRGDEPADADWRVVDLEYGEGRCPLRIERTVAAEAGVLPEAVRFKAQIGKPGRSKAKKQVLEFLDEARQVIAFQVPEHVLVEEDWSLVHALLYFLQPRLAGLIQADGEGFYDADGKLLVTLD